MIIRLDLMFYTPPEMVDTRSTLRRERERVNVQERIQMEEQGKSEQIRRASEKKDAAPSFSGNSTLLKTPTNHLHRAWPAAARNYKKMHHHHQFQLKLKVWFLYKCLLSYMFLYKSI